MKFCAGKWNKKNFTNGDIVRLVSAMKETDLGPDAKDCLHDIVTSQFDTSMEPKKLFRKASRVYMQAQAAATPRKSRRHRSSVSTSTKKQRTCMSLICISLVFYITGMPISFSQVLSTRKVAISFRKSSRYQQENESHKQRQIRPR